jgi:hypothetical protein
MGVPPLLTGFVNRAEAMAFFLKPPPEDDKTPEQLASLKLSARATELEYLNKTYLNQIQAMTLAKQETPDLPASHAHIKELEAQIEQLLKQLEPTKAADAKKK